MLKQILGETLAGSTKMLMVSFYHVKFPFYTDDVIDDNVTEWLYLSLGVVFIWVIGGG